jgi:hypothetical protein
VPKPWITLKGELQYFRDVVKDIIRAAGLRDDLPFTSFRHGGFTEGADADMTDASCARQEDSDRLASCRLMRKEPVSSSFRWRSSAERREQKQPIRRNSR